jgi:hypothetical protein
MVSSTPGGFHKTEADAGVLTITSSFLVLQGGHVDAGPAIHHDCASDDPRRAH